MSCSSFKFDVICQSVGKNDEHKLPNMSINNNNNNLSLN